MIGLSSLYSVSGELLPKAHCARETPSGFPLSYEGGALAALLRLYKDPIIGWQLVTGIFGFAAMKKLCELIYAKDLIGDSPYRCA